MFSAKNPKKNDVVANCKKKVCPTYCCNRVLLAFCQHSVKDSIKADKGFEERCEQCIGKGAGCYLGLPKKAKWAGMSPVRTFHFCMPSGE